MSRLVLLIGSGHEQRHEGDGRACWVWQLLLMSDWGRREASHVGDRRSDGDHASDN